MRKIVHLGNIANNSFLNARLLEKFGYESTVICYDYFDPCATPEWEEADFPEDYNVRFDKRCWLPDRLSYNRPSWFVQGYATTCQKYFVDKDHRSLNKENGLTPTNTISQWWRAQRARLQHHAKRLTPYPREWKRFKRLYLEKFPDRKPLSDRDLAIGYRWSKGWGSVLNRFDIIQAYACEPIVPMLNGLPYFAFEHGTLREIPFEDSARGRLTALSYAMAEHIFVTNFDCLANAEKLAEDNSKVSMINHPFDEQKSLEVGDEANLRAQLLCETKSEYLVFFPTRHDWVAGRGFNDKANDVLIRAIALIHKRQGVRVGIVLCEWGNNVQDTRKLLGTLGLAEHVKWMQPMPFSRFAKYCRASDIVADQFKLGSFGGIFFKAMSLGVPVCSFIDEDQFLRVYKELPAFVNGKEPESLADDLIKVLNDDSMRRRLGLMGRQWLSKHHTGEKTAKIQMLQYEKYLIRIKGSTNFPSSTKGSVNVP